MKKNLVGIAVVILLPVLLVAQDRSKKAYELIYEDIQVLKKQVFAMEEKLGQTAEAVELLKVQVRELQTMVRQLQADQANVQAGLRNIPTQYQFVLEKLDRVYVLLSKLSENLMMGRGQPLQPTEPGQESKEAPPPEKKTEPPAEAKAEPQAPRAVSLSPQDVYNAAYSDYLKGSFDLAVDGFRIYRENFPDSPLADNALYWIGECYFSQKIFDQAVTEFNDLILNFPQSDKIAAAFLKKGLALAELGRKEEAIVTLKLLMSKYPLEEESRIAQEKVKELSSK
jgi:tol-pal system protein YbgF